MMTELTPTEIWDQKLYIQWGLSEDEFNQIRNTLGRLPNFTETGLFAAMWSEHCAYKNSKPLLKQFPTTGQQILQGPGEGAGIVDIGDGQAVVFKAESHNHPTAVEPYQGAATGVGGIIRDIFSMGARPIALMDSLHFGELTDARTKYLVDQTVAGIGDYGNCMGIPTVGGETTFDAIYQNNPVMNAMCVGLLNVADQQRGAAAGGGNSIYYVGAKTGRDGIQGAIFASTEFNDAQATQRSAVQVGDPFAEKQLMEACLELIHNHAEWLVGIQDMGAAGLVSSSAEMGAKAGFGMCLDLDLVPQREADMTPYELMLSESQERMLLCVKQGHEREVEEIFAKYDSTAVKIGEVTEDQRYQLVFKGAAVADVPIHALVDEAPTYHRPSQKPQRVKSDGKQFQPQVKDLTATFNAMLRQATIANKEAIFERYDAQVQTNTISTVQSDAAKEKIEYEISVVKNKLEDHVSSLFNETDVIDKTLQDISNINIDNSILEAREDELRKSISQLNERIEDKFVDSNELIDETKGWINLFADKLGVSNVVQNKKYIFTRDIKSISGTIYYKVVFSFKMAYIKTIEKYTGIILPIVLDSPSGREVTNRNITEVIEILNEYFLKNQIIIASINKYKLEGVKEIDLTTDKIFS